MTGSHGPPGTAPDPGTLRVATRRSALATAQSRAIGDRLAALTGRRLELVEVTTRGDVDRGPLTEIGGTGVFVVAVRQAVVDGLADVAVHSLKDLPTAADPRVALAAIPPREDPRDVLVARDGTALADLPGGALIGTGSPRRHSQITAARPDLEVVGVRGNVDTRIGRVRRSQVPASDAQRGHGRGDLDAVVLAAAGLARLGRLDEATEHLDQEVMMPAPGQGALAVEVRSDVLPGGGGQAAGPGPESSDPELAAALLALDDADTRAAVVAERALLAELEAGCSAPIGALARVESTAGRELRLSAVLARPDGSLVRMTATGSTARPEALGRRLAARMAAARTPEGPFPAGDRLVEGSITAHRGSSQ